MRKIVSLVATIGLSGCVPAVTHAPRIEPGLSLGTSLSVAFVPQYENSHTPFGVGPDGVDIGAGFTTGTGGAGILFSGELGLVRFDPDVYVQVPRRYLFDLDGGLGFAATFSSPPHGQMPYVQLGKLGSEGDGPYVMLGYLRQSDLGESHYVLRANGWTATLAYQGHDTHGRLDTRFRWRAFVTGILGRPFRPGCGLDPDCTLAPKPWAVLVGWSFDRNTRP